MPNEEEAETVAILDTSEPPAKHFFPGEEKSIDVDIEFIGKPFSLFISDDSDINPWMFAWLGSDAASSPLSEYQYTLCGKETTRERQIERVVKITLLFAKINNIA